jgi:hypothetical protein
MYKQLMAIKEPLRSIIKSEIEKALKSRNMFWWGCLIGITRGRIDIVRVNEGEKYSCIGFKPIVRVKFLSQYDDKVKSKIIKWYKI